MASCFMSFCDEEVVLEGAMSFCWNHMTWAERDRYVQKQTDSFDAEVENLLRKFAGREQALWAYYDKPLALSVNVGPSIDPLDGACSA